MHVGETERNVFIVNRNLGFRWKEFNRNRRRRRRHTGFGSGGHHSDWQRAHSMRHQIEGDVDAGKIDTFHRLRVIAGIREKPIRSISQDRWYPAKTPAALIVASATSSGALVGKDQATSIMGRVREAGSGLPVSPN